MTMTEFFEMFPTEKHCEDFFIKLRWNDKENITCPHCRCDKCYVMKSKVPFKCSKCRKLFSVKTGTVLAESNIRLQKWLLAVYFLTSAKKGMSSVELAEKIGTTQKTAWFLAHRIRKMCEAFNIIGGTVEVDATFIGGKEKNKHSDKKLHENHAEGKTAVMGAVSRETKQVVAYPTGEESRDVAEKFIKNKVEKNSMIYADNSYAYDGLVPLRVNHSKGEYVRDDIHTNNIEGFWANVKRGYSLYHWWSKKHMKRYINEFSFRYNHRENKDGMIATILRNSIGKHLSYKMLLRG